ncbi:MAG: tRNA (adenosine(37)-N6)-threonylcarbamoyltransferase complex ATPase subunit type 1 TsaE [Candidatus Daviesbacteria bacterium]|nr:tRNA (adenosine(37)-N6)-threonylcarbamoyltransferase complex ATPase subunit type 1 TsaE [Candidatus Daviesbacteria bacterium]
MRKFITNSAEETQQLAAKLSQEFKNGGIITLDGPLGAGKTTFVAGFAKELGIKSKILSPTYILMRQYDLPYEKQAKLFHIDLYRLEDKQEIDSIGLNELFLNPKNIFLIEWAEKLTNLPKTKITKIQFEYLNDTSRQIIITD